MRFARNVHYQVKEGKTNEFQALLTSDVLPLLKKQQGFKDELTMVNGRHTIGISLWEDKPSAETYNKDTYPAILAKLTPMLDGAPRVETFDVTTPVA